MGCSRQRQAGPQKRTGRLGQHISPRHRKSRAEGVSFEASRYSPSPGFSTMLSIGVNRGHGTCSTTTVPESNCQPRRSPRPLGTECTLKFPAPASRNDPVGSAARLRSGRGVTVSLGEEMVLCPRPFQVAANGQLIARKRFFSIFKRRPLHRLKPNGLHAVAHIASSIVHADDDYPVR